MRVAVVLVACLAVAITSPTNVEHQDPNRIVGGSVTTISQYPYAVVMLYSPTQTNFAHSCGGSILNQRSVLTAAHCFWLTGMVVGMWRSRVGSSFASSGGTVHLSSQIINHPQYNPRNEDNDVSILRVSTNIQYIPNTVAPASIAGANYNLADNQVVWAIGWGRTQTNGPVSEQLRHVQIWTINTVECRQRWAIRNMEVTNNMVCSGYLNVGGRDQCHGDSGGPLLHNNVVVGVCSWGYPCADPFYPGVNARVSSVSNWIQANA